MMEKNKRILWICNHTTLMESECALLESLGFEVFVPKQLPQSAGINARTAKVITQYDSSLSIPKDSLDKLNNFNFYDNYPDKKISEIINKYFGSCFCVTIYPGICHLAQCFKGLFFVRVFGHAGQMSYELATTYVENTEIHKLKDRFLYYLGKKFRLFRGRDIAFYTKPMFLFNQIKNRIFLASAYDNIGDNEPSFFKKRDVYLPLGIPESIMKNKDKWKPEINKIAFVCPNIEIPYYRIIYDNFINNFNGLPYVVLGKNENKYNDENIIGYLSRQDYDKYLLSCKCMFYHSQEPRHLHYHPLEAIVYGMPLIFMKGGMLEHLFNKSEHSFLPGMVSSYAEAREKIERLLNDDMDLIESIKSSQSRIIESFSEAYLKKIWESNFLKLFPKE